MSPFAPLPKRSRSPGLVLSENTANLTGQVNDMAKLFQPHQVVHLHGLGLAHSVDVVSSEIDQHDVFGPVLFAC